MKYGTRVYTCPFDRRLIQSRAAAHLDSSARHAACSNATLCSPLGLHLLLANYPTDIQTSDIPHALAVAADVVGSFLLFAFAAADDGVPAPAFVLSLKVFALFVSDCGADFDLSLGFFRFASSGDLAAFGSAVLAALDLFLSRGGLVDFVPAVPAVPLSVSVALVSGAAEVAVSVTVFAGGDDRFGLGALG